MSSEKCILCKTPLLGRKEARGEFCCAGCARVHEILTRMDEGAGRSYLEAAKRMGLVPADGVDPDTADEKVELPDDPDAVRQERYICEGMFCPSCAWIVEQVLESSPGVIKAEVDYFSGSAKVSYDLRQTTDSDLATKLKPLGYEFARYRDEDKARIGKRMTLEFLVAAVLTMNLMTLSFVRYAEGLGWIGGSPSFLPWLELLLTLPVLYIGWLPTMSRAIAGMVRGRLTMDLLIGIAVGAAAFLSLFALINGRNDIYFETCAGLVTISLLSRMIEAKLRQKAFEDLAPLLNMPVTQARTVDENGLENYVAVKEIEPEDKVRFLEGETVPFDGTVLGDRVFVSEAVLTGEPKPKQKVEGDNVTAGSTLVEGCLTLLVTRRYEDTKLSFIAASAQRTIGKAENKLRSADRISMVFVPSVLAVSIGAWATRLALYGLDFALSPEGWFPSVAVLAVACPCAFSLAGVCAITAATGALLKRGVLVKEPVELENLHLVDHIVFDKTGTLTEGAMKVEQLVWRHKPDEETLRWALGTEQGSTHPIATALRAYLQENQVSKPASGPFETKELFGQGQTAQRNGRVFCIGNASLFKDLFQPDQLTSRHSPVWFGFDGHAEGCFLVADIVRRNAAQAMSDLTQRGLTLELLSGDREETTANVAKEVEIKQYRGEVSAEEKSNRIKQLRTDGKTPAFVGDGTNDALAMGQAEVSIALTNSTDEALSASGFVALTPRLDSIPHLFKTGHKLKRVVRANYVWAFAFNTMFIPVAVYGKLVPLVAMVLMLVSSTAVLVNSLRLRH